MRNAASSGAAGRDLDEVPWTSIETGRVRQCEDLFYLVTAASFIESGADLYTGNLVRFFSGDAVVTAWLDKQWRPEEVRHGRVLRTYVGHAWHEFDWDKAYARFIEDYTRQCTVDEFEPTRTLELAARCVVETGTATYYQALAAQAVEPILAGIAQRIRVEEISHYKHFYSYFRQYQCIEPTRRLRVLAALGRRVLEARSGDGDCALRHVFAVRQTAAKADSAEFQALSRRLGRQLARHYPVEQAVKMLVTLLDLPPGMVRALQPPLARVIAWTIQ